MSEVESFWCHEASNILCVRASDFDRVTAERDGLQISLNTADQSIDELNAAISRRTHRARELEGLLRTWRHGRDMTLKDCAILRDQTDAALKQAEGYGDEAI